MADQSLDLNFGISAPLEGVIIASLNFASKCVDFAAVERQTMDAALRARKDELTIRALERADDIADRAHKLLLRGLDDLIAKLPPLPPKP